MWSHFIVHNSVFKIKYYDDDDMTSSDLEQFFECDKTVNV